jgi:hypothetical protein
MENAPAVQLTPSSAVANIEAKFPKEAAFLKAMIKKEIIALGIDEAFVLRDKDGEIRAFKQVCRLSIANGGLVRLPIGGGVNIVSAEGYEMLAEKAGASVIFPSDVNVYGKKMENPASLTDKDGNWTGWVVRAAAFRFSSMGIPQVSDRTVVFNIETWKNIDFLAKARKYKQAFRIRAKEAAAPDEKGDWICYPFDSSASLWVNASHEEALDWYAEISQRIKNSLQLAQTHAARNSVKHLLGVQKAPDQSGVYDVPLVTWRPVNGGIIKWDQSVYKNLQNKVSGLVSGDKSEFKEIELNTGVDQLGEEDIQAVNAGEVDETSHISQDQKDEAIDIGQAEPTPEPEKPAPEKPKTEPKTKAEPKAAKKEPTAEAKKLTAEEQKVMNNLKVMAGNFPVEFEQACKNAGVDVNAYALTDAPALIDQMNKILNG